MAFTDRSFLNAILLLCVLHAPLSVRFVLSFSGCYAFSALYVSEYSMYREA